MGCFSFKCQKCGRGVKSSSFSGEKTHLFLLKKGKVVQQMTGEYDSYGRVFKDNTQDPSVKHDLRESDQWKDPFPEKPPTEHDKYFIDKGDDHWIWHRVTDLMCDADITNGIAAIHVSCYDGVVPTVISESDPDQGWGSEDDEENYFASTEGKDTEYPLPKPIVGYDVKKELRRGFLQSKIWRLNQDLNHEKLMYDSKKLLNELNSGDKYLLDYYKDNITRIETTLKDYKKELKTIGE